MNNEEYSVLFVCTANRIRSVMAQALLNEQIRAEDVPGAWRIDSAGTWAMNGFPPMPKAVEVMAELGLDISDHRSQAVDQVPLSSYALILVMERGHQEALTLEFPEFADRIHLIGELTGGAYEVHDPVAGTLQDYRRTAETLRDILVNGFDRLRQLAAEGLGNIKLKD